MERREGAGCKRGSRVERRKGARWKERVEIWMEKKDGGGWLGERSRMERKDGGGWLASRKQGGKEGGNRLKRRRGAGWKGGNRVEGRE